MSRIGKLAIIVPPKVTVQEKDRVVKVKGPLGELDLTLPEPIDVKLDNGMVSVICDGSERKLRALHGLTRSLLSNMVAGVVSGYKKSLEIKGVGYRAEPRKHGGSDYIMFSVGYSHPIYFEIPKGIDITVEGKEGRRIHVSGIDRQAVGQTAAIIRSFRPPEPYKGKGIKYSDEVVRRKAGKSAG